MMFYILMFYLSTQFGETNLNNYVSDKFNINTLEKNRGVVISMSMGCLWCKNKLINNLKSKRLKSNTFIIISLSYRTIPKKLEGFWNKKNIYFDFQSSIIRSNVGIIGHSFIIFRNNNHKVIQITPKNIYKISDTVWL